MYLEDAIRESLSRINKRVPVLRREVEPARLRPVWEGAAIIAAGIAIPTGAATLSLLLHYLINLWY